MSDALDGLAELARQRVERSGLAARLEVARAQHQRAQERVAEAAQLTEADTAARQAHHALQQAAQHLGSAGSWATYDTFFGGGLVGDLMKHQRLDQAAALMRAADAALARLATELADVGVGAVGEVGITQLTRALDVWFDNIFSDWAVRDRIGRAANRVQELLAAVGAVGQELQRRQAAVAQSQQELAEERERLLTGDA